MRQRAKRCFRVFKIRYNSNMKKDNKSAKETIEQIIEGIQDKKGREIVIVDMLELGNSICDYFVICEGNSPAQVNAITGRRQGKNRVRQKALRR